MWLIVLRVLGVRSGSSSNFGKFRSKGEKHFGEMPQIISIYHINYEDPPVSITELWGSTLSYEDCWNDKSQKGLRTIRIITLSNSKMINNNKKWRFPILSKTKQHYFTEEQNWWQSVKRII